MSIKELLEKINNEVISLCYEPNQLRRGWELHKIEPQDYTLRDNPEFHNKYYLIDCYIGKLTGAEEDLLYSYADGLIQKAFENFMTGRTSLSEQINTSMEDWENRFLKDLEVIKRVKEKRDNFIKNNSVK